MKQLKIYNISVTEMRKWCAVCAWFLGTALLAPQERSSESGLHFDRKAYMVGALNAFLEPFDSPWLARRDHYIAQSVQELKCLPDHVYLPGNLNHIWVQTVLPHHYFEALMRECEEIIENKLPWRVVVYTDREQLLEHWQKIDQPGALDSVLNYLNAPEQDDLRELIDQITQAKQSEKEGHAVLAQFLRESFAMQADGRFVFGPHKAWQCVMSAELSEADRVSACRFLLHAYLYSRRCVLFAQMACVDGEMRVPCETQGDCFWIRRIAHTAWPKLLYLMDLFKRVPQTKVEKLPKSVQKKCAALQQGSDPVLRIVNVWTFLEAQQWPQDLKTKIVGMLRQDDQSPAVISDIVRVFLEGLYCDFDHVYLSPLPAVLPKVTPGLPMVPFLHNDPMVLARPAQNIQLAHLCHIAAIEDFLVHHEWIEQKTQDTFWIIESSGPGLFNDSCAIVNVYNLLKRQDPVLYARYCRALPVWRSLSGDAQEPAPAPIGFFTRFGSLKLGVLYAGLWQPDRLKHLRNSCQ